MREGGKEGTVATNGTRLSVCMSVFLSNAAAGLNKL